MTRVTTAIKPHTGERQSIFPSRPNRKDSKAKKPNTMKNLTNKYSTKTPKKAGGFGHFGGVAGAAIFYPGMLTVFSAKKLSLFTSYMSPVSLVLRTLVT